MAHDDSHIQTDTAVAGATPSSQHSHRESAPTGLSVYDYVMYREFLKSALQSRQTKNPSYSESAFLKQAGFGKNSRGYFSLIINGKRNLSSKSIIGFAHALKLNEKETLYFENLVHYNQATTERDKTFYFNRISQIIKGRETKTFEVLKSQFHYYSHWYLAAIFELTGFEDFKEEAEWIQRKLRGEISAKQIRDAIDDLINLGLLSRTENGRLKQVAETVRFTDSSMNYTVVTSFHTQMLQKAEKSLIDDDYEDRSTSCVLMGCDASSFSKIRQEIKDFRKYILDKYGTRPEKKDAVLNLGMQLFHVTPVKKEKKK